MASLANLVGKTAQGTAIYPRHNMIHGNFAIHHGGTLMYNDHLNFAKYEIMNDFAQKRVGTGYQHHMPSFNYRMTTTWNPAQQACYHQALDELAHEGLLEKRNAAYYLSPKGEQFIYGR